MKKIWIITILMLSLSPSILVKADTITITGEPHISFKVELIEWNIADSLLPKYSKFTVIDIETGKSFRVQRRAGRNHTDVQPLTSKDTKIMKEIYSGKWSWKRRAILVQTNDYLIPASMHGMPHGAGAIQNNFPGHFCIHFQGSKTHKTKEMDYSHKLMILKAAGLLDDYVSNLNSEDLLRVFIEGINQHDLSIIALTTTTSQWNKNIELKNLLKDVETIKIKNINLPHTANESLVTDAVVEVSMYTKSKGKQKGHFLLPLSRSSLIDSWEVLYEDVAIFIK